MPRTGRSNPNRRHNYDDALFQKPEWSEGLAYLLGWIASDGTVRKSGVRIEIHTKDASVIPRLAEVASGWSVGCRKDRVSLTVSCAQIARDVCGLLAIEPGPKSRTVRPPVLPAQYHRAFLRGYFDGDGSVSSAQNRKRYPVCNVTSNSPFILDSFVQHSPSVSTRSDDRVEWSGVAALDFLAWLYPDNCHFYLPRKRDLYIDWRTWAPSLPGHYGRVPEFRWARTRPDAAAPTKVRQSDSGYDLTLVAQEKTWGDGYVMYDTGIKIQPEYGWYCEVVPRSSLAKSGYVLANSVGIIDQTYRGSIKVILKEVDPRAAKLALPCRAVQLIPRIFTDCRMVEVAELDDTARGQGGFGSTGR